MAASQQLARVGHEVHLYEKNSKLGGLLRYGIPDFKLDKSHIDRRINQLSEEGIIFHTNVNVGIDISSDEIINYMMQSYWLEELKCLEIFPFKEEILRYSLRYGFSSTTKQKSK